MFKCEMCGECCRHLKMNSIYSYLDRGDGICKFLDGNRCSIYIHRPTICNVDKMYEELYSEFIAKEEFYQINYEACRRLMNKEE